MKAVSVSVYGKEDMYCIGAIRNAELVSKFYPGWKCIVWHDDTVPQEVIEKLSEFDHVILKDMTGSEIPGMYWRFLCLDMEEVEIFCVRDADSRIFEREVSAVNDWLSKNKALHLMRDHPHHNYPVMGGMWGFRNDIVRFPIEKKLREWITTVKPQFSKMDDMDFIAILYSEFFHNCVVHDDWKRCPLSIQFPTHRVDKNFVGQIHFADETTTDHWMFL